MAYTGRGLDQQEPTPVGQALIEAATQQAARDAIGVKLDGFQNKLINGNFDVWQRGTSQTTSGYGSDDRWNNAYNGSSTSHSQQVFALGQTEVSHEPKFFSRTAVTSVAGADNYAIKVQRIEGVRTFSGKTATLSFYAKADAAKPIAIEFEQGFGTGGTPSAAVRAIGAQKLNLTTAWQKFTATVDIPSIAGKALGTNGDDTLGLLFWFDSGTNFATRSAFLGQQSGTFDIAQVELVEGTAPLGLSPLPYDVELMRCMRYYEIIPLRHIATWMDVQYTSARMLHDYTVIKRATPTISLTNGALYRIAGGTVATAILDSSASGFALRNDATAAGGDWYISGSASAEL